MAFDKSEIWNQEEITLFRIRKTIIGLVLVSGKAANLHGVDSLKAFHLNPSKTPKWVGKFVQI